MVYNKIQKNMAEINSKKSLVTVNANDLKLT